MLHSVSAAARVTDSMVCLWGDRDCVVFSFSQVMVFMILCFFFSSCVLKSGKYSSDSSFCVSRYVSSLYCQIALSLFLFSNLSYFIVLLNIPRYQVSVFFL